MGSLSNVARRILWEPCRLAFCGDSRFSDLGSTQMCTAWHKTLIPSRWSGWGGSGTENGSSLSGGIWGYIDDASIANRGIYYTPSGGAGDVTLWPCHFGDLTFASDYATDTTIAVPFSDTTATALFSGGDWTADALACKWMVYRSTGSTVGIANVGSWTRRIPSASGGTQTQSNSLSNGYNTLTQTLGALAERADLLLDAANPNIVETGKNIYIMGWRKYRDEMGLQVSFCGLGGATVADHINTAYISDTAIAKYVELYNINTCVFIDGHNTVTIDATWKANMTSWIARWRAAVTNNGGNFLGLLFSDYQTSTNTAQRVTDMETYLSQINDAANDLALVRIGSVDNGYALNNALLADNVHTSAAGAVYFGNMLQTQLSAGLNNRGGRGRYRLRRRW